MRKINLIVLATILLAIMGCDSNETYEWKPASNPLMTRWAADIEPDLPWPEYPRPQMQREKWINLNGLWDYQLQRPGEEMHAFDQKILVPYPIESALSGVADSVGPEDIVWYRREFEIPNSWKGKEILLNFEAVDWETKVMVNAKEVGTHKGGYDPFTFNITDAINESGTNELLVMVSDPSSEGFQPRGKQVLDPHGIWYTPSSGIWQTVWLEAVSEVHIREFKITTPRLDRIVVDMKVDNWERGDIIKVDILEGETVINSTVSEETIFKMEMIGVELKRWSPDTPFLYNVEISLSRNGVVQDEFKSYLGVRCISKRLADDGFMRLYLNEELVFHNGPLDQGFWPDGLYTPPTDEAMKNDIQVTKDLGFNMLRKHVKVENRRFYYWCDKLGIMVWQDMPSTSGYVGVEQADLVRPANEVEQFRYELERMILTKFNHPSIVMWVPFNEGWGQFDTEGIVEFIYSLDDTRLVNNTSGWADRGVGDVIDIHNYPYPRYPDPERDRASVLGEFGGLGLYVDGHSWEEKNWGYEKMDDSSSLITKYEEFYGMVWDMMDQHGLAAAVYTQTTDVETETNGLMTYDREIIKMDPGILYGINTNNYRTSGGEVEEIPSRTKLNPPLYYHPFDNRYTGGGFYALIDGKFGSLDFNDGKWQGYRDNSMDIMIDLGSVRQISSVSGNFLQNHEGWIFLPKLFSVSTAIDINAFQLQGNIQNEIPTDYLDPGIHLLSIDNIDVTARYVRIKAEGIGLVPKWLKVARERPSWFFIDEVIIK